MDNDSDLDNILYYCMCTNDRGCNVLPITLDQYSKEEAAAAWNTRHVETCRNVDADQGWFGCSECGCICSVDWYGSGFGTPNYCPKCGREVEG